MLMSEYAYNDAAIRNKLAPKGEAVAIKKGDVVELKTQTLKIGARVVDLVYGSGTPANAYFQQVTLELATWSDSISESPREIMKQKPDLSEARFFLITGLLSLTIALHAATHLL